MSLFNAKIQAILDTSKVPKQLEKIGKMKVTLSNFTLNTKGLPSQIQASLNKHTFTINLSGIKTGNISSQMQAEGMKVGNNFTQKINTAINNGSIDAAVATVQKKFSRLNETVKTMGGKNVPEQICSKMAIATSELGKLEEIQSKLMGGNLSGKALTSTWNQYINTLARTKNALKEVELGTQGVASASEVAFLRGKLTSWLSKNTRAVKTYGGQINGLINQLDNIVPGTADSKKTLNDINNAFKAIDQSAALAGQKGRSFGSAIKGAFQSITRYIGVSTLIYAAFNAIRQGIRDVIDLDTALIDLRKTTDGTETELREFYYSANQTAKNLGATTKQVIQAAAEWSRLGYSLEEAKTMAEVTSIFASISPGMNTDMATDGLVSAMKAFDIEAEDALDGIASKINAVGNTQAVNNQDLVNILTRSSSAMKEANNTLEETIALGTAATEITRDADSVGNALKTKSYIIIVFVYRNVHIKHI